MGGERLNGRDPSVSRLEDRVGWLEQLVPVIRDELGGLRGLVITGNQVARETRDAVLALVGELREQRGG